MKGTMDNLSVTLPNPITQLNSHSILGTYLVKTTSGSHYRIVLKGSNSSLTRLPAQDENDETWADESLPLRGDGKCQQLAALNVIVGQPGQFMVDGLADGKITMRQTTLVREIVKVS
jgi:hypothetical protein